MQMMWALTVRVDDVVEASLTSASPVNLSSDQMRCRVTSAQVEETILTINWHFKGELLTPNSSTLVMKLQRRL